MLFSLFFRHATRWLLRCCSRLLAGNADPRAPASHDDVQWRRDGACGHGHGPWTNVTHVVANVVIVKSSRGAPVYLYIHLWRHQSESIDGSVVLSLSFYDVINLMDQSIGGFIKRLILTHWVVDHHTESVSRLFSLCLSLFFIVFYHFVHRIFIWTSSSWFSFYFLCFGFLFITDTHGQQRTSLSGR